MSKVRVDTIATNDDSIEFDVAEIALLRDEVADLNTLVNSVIQQIGEISNALDAINGQVIV
jgi:hypothetical protein